MKDNPLDPGSSAMILDREEIRNDQESSEHQYWRIKVFAEAGRKWADVEILYPTGSFHITDLQARTVHADGTVVNWDGQAFDKIVLKGHGSGVLAKTFTLPDVQVGSILEYKFTLYWDKDWRNPYKPRPALYATRWLVQHELFTRRAHFSILPYFERVYFRGISFLPKGYALQQKSDGSTQLEAQNIPGIADERYMPPQDELKWRAYFYYLFDAKETLEQFWKQEGKEWYQSVEDFIGKHEAVQQEATALASGSDPPETRLRKLYARVQQMRNRSYERRRSEAEQKQEDLKDNKSVEDVLKHGYGYRSEINRLFVALARSAGFEAGVVRLAERDDGFFHREALDGSQLDGELAVVRLGEQDVYLDPGTPHCPFGLLSWEKTGVEGIRLDQNGGVFVQTPTPAATQAQVQRKATVRVDQDGTLTGSLEFAYVGQEALRRRLSAMHTDETGWRKAMEDEIKGLLPSTAELTLGKISGLEASEGPVTVEATVEIPAFGTSTGRRLLLPLGIFQVNNQHPFQHAERNYPVYFRFPFQETDDVNLELPAGYQVESLPPPQSETAGLGHYEVFWERRSGGGLRLHRQLAIAAFYFPTNYYADLRAFYTVVTAGDAEKVVVQNAQVGSK